MSLIPLPFLLPGAALQISRVTDDSSRFTHHPPRTHARPRANCTLVRLRSTASELRSAVVPARSPQPSWPRQSCCWELRSHRDRNGSTRVNETHAKHGNQSINPTHAAKRGKQGIVILLVPISTPACACIPPSAAVGRYCSPMYHEPRALSLIARVPAHALRVQSGWPRWRELAHAPVRDIPSCCAAALFGDAIIRDSE